MGFFTFRRHRKSVDIGIVVFVREKSSGKVSSGFVAGQMENISSRGACIVINKVLLQGTHLFYSTQQHSQNHIVLTGFSRDVGLKSMAAISVWMNTCTRNDVQLFQLGVQFVEEQRKMVDRL